MLSICFEALALGLFLTACTAPQERVRGTTNGAGTSGTAGGGDSLQGLLAFAPDTVLVTVEVLPDGGVDTSTTSIDFTKSLPPFTCGAQSGTSPPVLFYDAVDIKMQTYPGQIPAGTYSIDSTEAGCPGQFCNLLTVYGASDGSTLEGIAEGVSGSITLTKVGAEYAGSFSATVAFEDGGQSMLSGTFDTTSLCEQPSLPT